MKITVLAENTATDQRFTAEHGLSLYIETQAHRILFDAGQTEAFARNAELLGLDPADADVAVLSHGHYDHGGGLAEFLRINTCANIYLNNHAFGMHYNGSEKYIGLDPSIKDSGRLIFTGDRHEIDEWLTLFSCNDRVRKYKNDCFGLSVMRDGKLTPDDFLHEQYLLMHENGKKVLISGCSHKGILNIMDWFRPDVLVGGFHFMKLDPENDGAEALKRMAAELLKYDAKYYTCHCTGVAQYNLLKSIMGDKLEYISTGNIIDI